MKTPWQLTVNVKVTPWFWLKAMKKGIQDLQCNNLENEGLQLMLDEIRYLQSQRSITNAQ